MPYSNVAYAAVANDHRATQVAEWRRKRLSAERRLRSLAYATDLALSLGIPLTMGIGIATGATAVLTNVDGATAWALNSIYSAEALSALSTMLAFIVSSKLSSNLAKNCDAVGHFGNLASGCLNIAIWSRSMVTDPNTDFDYLRLADGFGGSYSTTEMGLLLASIPFIVKYTYRGTSVRYEELPLGSSDSLLRRVLELTNPNNAQVPVSGFVAAIMLIGEKIDGYEARGAIKPPEMATIFAQLGKLTAEEGTIGGGVVYSQPGIITLLLYITFFAYYALLILSDLGPNNEWNSLWITAVLIMSNLGVYALSVRYSNPFRVRTGNSTQRPLISQTCREMEVAIAGVYGRRRRFDSYPVAFGRSWRAPT